MSAFLRIKLNMDNVAKQEPLIDTQQPDYKIKWIKMLHKRRKLIVKICIGCSLIIVFIIFMIRIKPAHETIINQKHIIKLKCHQKANILSCKTTLKGGKFIIHAPLCDSMFEINGYPFHQIKTKRTNYYEVPFHESGVYIRDVESNCNIDVYQDTSENMQIKVPCMTWVASKQIETFTLTADDDTILSEVPAEILMVDEKGPWRAFQLDTNKNIKNFNFKEKKSKIYVYGCN